MISVYSVLSSVLFFNVALIVIFLLRRNTGFLVRYGASTLILLAVFAGLRLFVPIDLPEAMVLHSDTILPTLWEFMISPLTDRLPWLKPSAILVFVWIAGTLAFAVKDIVLLLRVGKERKTYLLVERPDVQALAKELSISVPVAVTPSVGIPCEVGVFRHTIYIPDMELPEEDLTFILRHEAQHVRGRDSWLKLFYTVLRDVFWWNPVVHLFLRDLDAMLELRCDVAVTAGMDAAMQTRYLRAILNLADSVMGKSSPVTAGVSAFAGQPCELRQRFEVLLNLHKRRSRLAQALVVLLVVALFLGSYMVIWQPGSHPVEEEIGSDSGVIYLSEAQGSYIEHAEGNYILHLKGADFSVELYEEMLDCSPFKEMPIIERNDAP